MVKASDDIEYLAFGSGQFQQNKMKVSTTSTRVFGGIILFSSIFILSFLNPFDGFILQDDSAAAKTAGKGYNMALFPEEGRNVEFSENATRYNPDCLLEFVEKVKESIVFDENFKTAFELWISQLYNTGGNKDYFSHYSPVLIPSADRVDHLIKSSICHSQSPRRDDTKIAIGLYTNGECANIQEWLMNYLLLGATEITIFDNSIPGTAQTRFYAAIAPFVEAGYLKVWSDWDSLDTFNNSRYPSWLLYHDHRQMVFQNTLIRTYRESGTMDWIGFFDDDELLTFRNPQTFFPPRWYRCMTDFVHDYTEYGGIGLRWRMVTQKGTPLHDSHRLRIDQNSFVEQAADAGKKMLLNLKYVDYMAYAHDANFVDGTKYIVNPDYLRIGHDAGQFANFVELVHFGFGDWHYGVLQKTCAPAKDRMDNKRHRMDRFIMNLEEKGLPLLKDDIVGLDELKAALFE